MMKVKKKIFGQIWVLLLKSNFNDFMKIFPDLDQLISKVNQFKICFHSTQISPWHCKMVTTEVP